jgi:hypothetical protein
MGVLIRNYAFHTHLYEDNMIYAPDAQFVTCQCSLSCNIIVDL